MHNKNYIGRFAPSPTGPLHFGSLVTAIASYFQAKSQNGKWLVRMEDIDKDREQHGAASLILKTLEAHHLFWDDTVIYQSTRQHYYEHAITKLDNLKKLYRCQCSRKTIRESIVKYGYTENVYPGTCRKLALSAQQPHSLRILVGKQTIKFNDTIQGMVTEEIQRQGDFVIRKVDGSVTYQLAVAIDDALQNITEVVRGVDLLDSCARQILIMKLLNYPVPQYSHIPVLCHPDGSKLSKQTGAMAIENSGAASHLWQALTYLNQNPPSALQNATIEELHSWAIQNWSINKISSKCNNLFYK
ncbi:MAG: tRNA glutamyl-Q(34) synthetase GluQRS [Gammaproteobacteria bacterium]